MSEQREYGLGFMDWVAFYVWTWLTVLLIKESIIEILKHVK